MALPIVKREGPVRVFAYAGAAGTSIAAIGRAACPGHWFSLSGSEGRAAYWEALRQACSGSRGRKRDYFAALQEGTRPLNVTGIERNAPDFRIESTASIGFVGDSLTRELAEAVAAIAL